MLDDKRRFVRNTLTNAAAQLASLLAGFMLMPWLLDAFGIVNYGLVMLVSAVTAYAALSDLGVGPAIVRTVSEYRARGSEEARADAEQLSESLGTALVFYGGVGILLAVVMLTIGHHAGRLFSLDTAQADLVRTMLTIGALLQLWMWPTSIARHVLAGLQRFDLLARSSLISTAALVVSAVLIVTRGEGPVMYVLASGLSAALGSGLNVLMARAGLSGYEFSIKGASFSRLRRLLTFGWAIFIIDLADVLFYQQTDRLVLGIVLGATAVALYEASAKVNGLITYLSGLTVSAAMPLSAGLDASGEQGALRALFLRGTKYSAAFIAPVVAVGVVLSAPLLTAWLGNEFAAQASVMRILIAPHVVVCLGVMGDVIVMSRGRMGKRVPFVIGQAVFNVILSVVLVQPRYGLGVMGVAVATALAHLVDFPIHVRFLLSEAHVSLGDWAREVVKPVYTWLVLPMTIAYGLAQTVLGGTLAGVGAIAVVSLGVYWVAVFRFGLGPAERADVVSVMRLLNNQPS